LQFSDSLSHETTPTNVPANKTSLAAIIIDLTHYRHDEAAAAAAAVLMKFCHPADVTLITLRYSSTLLY